MGPRRRSIPGEGSTTDGATLYLCRQGPTWVVVIESPGITGAVRLRHAGVATHDVWSELLSMARRACPGAAIVSADGALESADYEWRLEVRGVEAREGDLGLAIHHALGRATRGRETPPTTRVGPPLPLGAGPCLGPAALVLTAFLAAAPPRRRWETRQLLEGPNPTGRAPLHAGAVHLAAHARVVVQRVVHGAAVVPDGERVDRPAQAAGEVLVDAVPVQVRQQRLPTPPWSTPRSGWCRPGSRTGRADR